MSYASNSSTSNGIAPGQSGHYIVPPHAIQSAISTHQHNFTRIDKVARDDELTRLWIEWDAVYQAFMDGQISDAEHVAAQKRIMDANAALTRHGTDYDARKRAGKTKPGDLFKEFYGCTDEEAQECIRYDRKLADIKRANEARNQTRILQQSRLGRGG